MGKVLIGLGIVLIIVGLLLHFELLKNFPLGRLPGDIAIENENSKFYFPLTTSILLSIVLSLVMYIIRKFFN